jgi:hypothetical protein
MSAPPRLTCARCRHRHRLGYACPPPIPPLLGLDRVALAYWQRLNADMARARAVDATGLKEIAA